MKHWFLFAFVLLCFNRSFSQINFSVDLEEISINNFPAVHSGAFAVYENKWIFIGGRTNGLHGFQPPFAFPSSGINDQIWVIDPQTEEIFSADATILPVSIRESVLSSNIEFYQRDSTLYMVGGYGFSDSVGDFTTFKTLTAINLGGLTDAVINNTIITPYFRQMSDSVLRITGGYLQKIDSVFYLVWGHDFEGHYSVNDTLGFFTQQYSYEIRKFQIDDDGVNLSISNYESEKDTNNFRRRDFNLVPQIFPNGEYGLTGFSGVFQKNINLPHTNTVDIKSSGSTINNSATQNLNQYHTAILPVYDSSGNNMHTIFFGGMGLYHIDSATQLAVIDSLVPFVKTISMMTREANGTMTEYSLNETMPGFLGTNAYFLIDPDAPQSEDGIINLNGINGKTLVGYVVGGIESPLPNVSAIDPTMTNASNRIFEVYLDDDTSNSIAAPVVEPFKITAYPNPFRNKTSINIMPVQSQKIDVAVLNAYGQKIETLAEKFLLNDHSNFIWNARKYSSGIYYVYVKSGDYVKIQPVVLSK